MAIKKKAATKPGTKSAKKKAPAWDEIAKKSEGTFKKSRENPDNESGAFKVPDIDDGEYKAKPKKFKVGTFAEKIVGGKLMPAGLWATLTFVVTEGDYEGTSLQMRFSPNSEKQMDFMVGQLSRFGYDLSKFKLAELPDFFKEVCKESPEVLLKVTNGEYNGKKQLGVYINGLAE